MSACGMYGRRTFLVNGFALVASALAAPVRAFEASLEEVSRPLPPYYDDYLKKIAARVNELAATTQDGFWFITDLHITANVRQSGKMLAALAKLSPLTKVVCGGDLPEAFSMRFGSSKEGVDYAVNFYKAFWVDPIEQAGMLLYTAKGNHDFTIRRDAKSQEGFTYPGIEARKIVMGSKGCAGVVTNPADPEACYYYFDNPSAKLRYIVADTTDTVDSKRSFWAVVYGMHETQLRWLADNAIATIPDGWAAVVIHHIPITDCVGDKGDRNRFAAFRELLEAYQNRGKTTCCGKTYDFSQARGRILLDLTGHEHAEREAFQNGILHVTNPCDAAYGDYILGSSPWCGNLPRKQRGTIYEQTFDAVQIDAYHERIHFTRVGGGQDRVIHTRPVVVHVGQELPMQAPLLKGDLTWGCYDADHVTYTPNPKNRYTPLISYSQTFATVNEKGVLKGVKPGDVMVMARDAALNKEIFPVTVVA